MFRIIPSDKPESSWQEMMLSASLEAFRGAHKNNDDNASLLMALHCPDMLAASDTCSCTDDSYAQLLLRILRWIKLLIVKLAASYYALPVVLALLPLTVGLAIGYYFGASRRSSVNRTKTRQSKKLFANVGSIFWFVQSMPYTVAAYCATRWSTESLQNADTKSDRREPAITQSDSRDLQLPSPISDISQREEAARKELRSDRETRCESGVAPDQVPKHVAIIMDGNRRYGKQVHGNATSGHWDGSRKVLQVAKWCIAEHIKVLTVFAFSTENWRRDPTEIASLMALFTRYCEELRVEAIQRNIRVRVLSTDDAQVPAHVKAGFETLQRETTHCVGGLEMNICLSYGGRGEIVNACRQLAKECVLGQRAAEAISEKDIDSALLTSHTCDPDVLIRTSGEERISNFLLWQLAYTELFFLDCHWPEFSKDNLLAVIRSYAQGRRRRFGK